ncbi:hypothetical protein I3842_01G138200 [Carya illinoinensis]|nr:hypothetical protein I3842_01G138200 [Carya illinoinensis]KAG6731612.1 hypothetical protein I3842_01G138200 [Carya illinoinensis]KAG6731613.1 hypothetical protein I3842_01G138200 [Carya illinoinensis]
MAKSGETLYKDQTIFYEFSSTRSSLFPLVSHLFSKISQVSFLFLSPELLLHPITLVQSTASIQVQLSPSPMDPFISKLSKTRKLHLSHSLDFSFILSASHSARSSKPSVTLAPISTSFRRI